MSGLFLVGKDGRMTEMHESQYDSEDLLQDLIAKYPDVLSGDKSNGSVRWILVSREFPVPDAEDGSGRWSLDHLFIDHNAIPTLVEVKRSTDTRIRREVVGQLLDYAANGLQYWPIDDIRRAFEDTCTLNGIDPSATLAELVGPQVDEVDVEAFWNRVRDNLQLGRVRLVFASDMIPRELQRVVEFLNTQMNPAEVLALEIKQYVGGHIRALSPRTVGAATGEDDVSRGQWTESRFFDVLHQNHPDLVHVARRLYEWGKSTAQVAFGRGKDSGSFNVSLRLSGRTYYTFVVWTYAKVELYFGHYGINPPFDDAEAFQEIVQRLNAIDGIVIPPNPKYPKIPLELLQDDAKCKEFMAVFEWYFEKAKDLN